ncbi:MAG: phenylalanyl-tRNA synthetase beta chain, partial [Thermoleophilaceae bacterium]|nr:phenylalanyl-tRNA synthetase beta chain [Thermoleophilaceae bacterium]
LDARVVTLRPARVAALLGAEVPVAEIHAILGRLGFGVADGGGALSVTVPPWRFADVEREADLIEEVGRVYGLDRLPITLPARRRAVGRLTPAQRLRRRLEDALRDRGLSEVVSYSFTAPATLARLRLDGPDPIALANPLSEDQSVMRPLLLPGLLDAAARNAAHGTPSTRLFESAHVYPALDGGTTPSPERHHVAALFTGHEPAGWRTAPRPVDYHSAKAILEAVLHAAGVAARTEDGARPFLHPGRAATVMIDAHEVGWIGEIHPSVAGEWDLDRAAGFEVDFDALAELAPGPTRFEDLTTFPAVLLDIAVVVPEDVPAAEVEEKVRMGAGDHLASLGLFDVYRGEQVGQGSKSLALRLEFRAPDRTLTDAEIPRDAIESGLAEIGGRLRA